MVFRLCLFIILSLLSVLLNAQLLDFRCLSSADELPAEGVYDLVQDDKGRLLIATEGGGLVRFDGKETTSWNRNNQGIPDTLRCIERLPDGRILLGSMHSGFWEWSEDAAFCAAPTELVHADVRDLHLHNDTLFIATHQHGLWQLTDKGSQRLKGVPDDVRSLISLGDSLVVATGEGLFFFHQSSVTRAAFPPLDQQLLHLYVDASATLWVGAQSGVFRFNGGVWSRFGPPEWADLRFRAIARDAQGDLWLGTRDGLYEWDEDQNVLHFYDQTNGLSNNRIRSIFHDSFGNIWFGTAFGGVCRLNGAIAMRFSRDQGFPESPVSALSVLADSSVCFGTIDGELFNWREDNGLRMILNLSDPISHLSQHGDTLHAAFRNGLILKGVEQKRSRRQVEGGLLKPDYLNNRLYLLYGDKIKLPGAVISSLDLACEDFRDLLVTPDSLYIASKCGLFVFQLKTDGSVVLPDNLLSIEPRGGRNAFAATALIADMQGNVWIGTEQQGVLKYNGSIEKLPLRHLNHPSVIALTTDTLENLWVATPRGLNYLELDPSQSFVLSDRQLSVNDGISVRIMPHALVCDQTGILWAGTSRGLFKIDPDGGFHNPTPPALSLTRLDIHFEPLPDSIWRIDHVPEFAHTANHIGFHFEATDLSANETPPFQCRLSGVEEGWEELGPASRHYYPGLSPGNYTFELRAQNRSGLWNDPPLRFSFVVDAPFYSEWWFILLAIILATVLVLLAIRIRLRQLERRNRFLQHQVDQRTRELQSEKEESERLLLNILPADTARELKKQGFARSRLHREASVLFCDLKGFTRLTEELEPKDLVGLLDQVFRCFDRACDRFGVEKIKTIGDAYMCATGLPAPAKDHALRLTRFALHIQQEMHEINTSRLAQSLPVVELRVGIHSGQLIAGVVGEKKFAYDIWGDTVNIAARMESSGQANKINVSRSTYELIQNEFVCSFRGKVSAKNKGELEMYFVVSERKDESIHENR